jgi:hypothetical protein
MPSLPPSLRHCTTAAILCLLLSACGGGGGSAGNSNVYNLDAAITRVLQNGLPTTTLRASVAGVGFTLQQSFAPLAPAVFEGVARQSARQTVTISGNGSSETSQETLYFSLGPYAEAGSVGDDGTLTVAVPTATLPTTARTGSGGALATSITYADASKRVEQARTTTTWTLEAEDEAIALACLRAVVRETGDPTPLAGALCWRINTAGDVLGSVVSISFAGTTVEFR